jgi:hypothetical protein
MIHFHIPFSDHSSEFDFKISFEEAITESF